MESLRDRCLNNSFQMENLEIRESGNSMLTIAKKKIILPDSKTIVENFASVTSSDYKPKLNGAYEKMFTGILLAKKRKDYL